MVGFHAFPQYIKDQEVDKDVKKMQQERVGGGDMQWIQSSNRPKVQTEQDVLKKEYTN
jgi:hypothetical protein